MTYAISYLFRALATGFDYIQKCLPHSVDIMVEMPPFGANEWKEHLGLNVTSPEIPDNILKALEESCPNQKEKLKKETHLLCLAPDIETLKQLNHSPDLKSRLDRYKATSPKAGPYWFLISKAIIPSTEYSFDLQKQLLSEKGYDAPYLIEAAVASYAAQAVGNFKIFHGEYTYTKCYETFDQLLGSGHIAVGGESHFEITVNNSVANTNGIAGVIR